MKAARITLGSLFVSFRDPTTHKFQRTLPLPPTMTVKGFLGAAFGLPPEEANKLDVRLGILLHRCTQASGANCAGRATDLWKYDKYKSGKRETKATVRRDLLYRNDFLLYVVPGDSGPEAEAVKDAVCDPRWALSLGRDDELVRVLDASVVDLRDTCVSRFSDSLLPFDFKERGGKPAREAISAFLAGASRVLEPPLVVSLPVEFLYKSNGAREPVRLQPFTFVGSMPIALEQPVDGAVDDELDKQIALC